MRDVIIIITILVDVIHNGCAIFLVQSNFPIIFHLWFMIANKCGITRT